jgi:hypothetical protein
LQRREETFDLKRAQQAVSNLFQTAASVDGQFAVKSLETGKLGVFNLNNQEIASLISFNENEWAIVAPDGRFDTNKLENPTGLHWVFPDAPLKPLSFEIFMRDYYEPQLLPRLLNCNAQNNCPQEFVQIPQLAELNRNQPKVEKITVLRQTDDPHLVDVKVEVASIAGQCVRGSKYIACESGVYDLRLYRDGQIVGRSSNSNIDTSKNNSNKRSRQDIFREWRKETVVRTAAHHPVSVATGKHEVVFRNIRLPKRAEVSQVVFTAYAFNEDRVKSETSKPTVHFLTTPRTPIRRRAYVVTVGVDITSDRNVRLLFAPNGARDIERLLKEKLQATYEVVPVQLISEFQENGGSFKQSTATKINIKRVLSILSGQEVKEIERRQIPNQDRLQAATPDDLVILYMASHGYTDLNGTFHIMPSDLGISTGETAPILKCLMSTEGLAKCKQDRLKAAQLFLQHSISSDDLTQWLESIDAGEMILILDSCHSATVPGPHFKPGPMGDKGFGQLSYDKGMRILAATQADNLAFGGIPLHDRSVLTFALTQGNEGQTFDLESWLGNAEEAVPRLYKRYFAQEKQQPQEPVFFNFAGKYPR